MERCRIKKPPKFDPTRDDRQKEIVIKWLENGAKGSIHAVTGFGKSRVLLLAAQRLGNSDKIESPSMIVIVPSIKLEEDWNDHLEHFDINWEVRTIQGLIQDLKDKRNAINVDLLILEEVHNYTAPEFRKVFEIIDYDYIFGATATLDNDPKYELLHEKCPVIDEVPLQEALDNDWVSEFQIYNLGISLTPQEEQEYEQLNKRFYNYFATFDFDFGVMMRCLTDAHFRKQYAKRMNWDEGAIMTHAVQGNRAVQARKKMLYNLPGKLDTAKEIIERFDDRLFITFSLTTEFAESLAQELGDIAVAYYSNMPTQVHDKESDMLLATSEKVDGKTRYVPLGTSKKLTWKEIKEHFKDRDLTRKGPKTRRKEALKAFEKVGNGIQVISTAKALDEGFNIEGINASIVTSRTGKTRQSIQRLGRMLRYQEGKRAFQVEVYAKDTQDEKWLRSCQKQSTNIKYISSIDEIE